MRECADLNRSLDDLSIDAVGWGRKLATTGNRVNASFLSLGVAVLFSLPDGMLVRHFLECLRDIRSRLSQSRRIAGSYLIYPHKQGRTT